MNSDIYIIKRDGRKELLDINKIHKYTKAAVEGLKGVSQSELEVSSKIFFKDGMTSAEIQQSLIKTAVSKIDIDSSNWTFVAARLFLYDLYHRVTGTATYDSLEKHFERCEKEERVTQGLKDLYDLELLNQAIKPERDLQFNYLGIKTIHDRYLIKDKNGEVIELPQYMFMGIAMFLAQNEKDRNQKAIDFYNIISKFEVMLATPTLSNARTTKHQLSSCYIGSSPDSIEGIFDSYKEMALLSKYGGGIGWDFNNIRSLGSSIDSHKKAAGGVIPFLKITNDLAIAVDQLGTRRGAIASYLQVWHQDILEFIELRKNSGEERRRTHDLFPAVWISDLFMERIKEDGDWTLFDPYEVPELSNTYGKEFEEYYLKYEQDKTITKETIKAKDLWKKILTNYFETGMPFLAFKDTANELNPNKHKGIIRSSNLCFTGDTKVATIENGVITIKTIEDLANFSKKKKKFRVYSAYEENGIWKKSTKEAIAFKTGESNVIELVLNNGMKFRCTPEHQLALKNGVYIQAKYSLGCVLEGFDFKHTTVIDVIDVQGKYSVYDLTVDIDHNFYIMGNDTNTGILVHNCTEIFQNTDPDTNIIEVTYEDGFVEEYTENEQVPIYDNRTEKGYSIPAKKITSIHSVLCRDSKIREVYHSKRKSEDGRTAVCNLASINLSKINTKEDIERIMPDTIRMLDNVISLNFYPLKKVKDTNHETRAIGLGVLGEAEFLANNQIMFGSQEHIDKIDEIMECISYNAINASSDLALERSSYPQYEGSNWSKGIFPHDYTRDKVRELLTRKESLDWDSLREKVKKQGMRNGYLMAIAPTSSISILVGSTQTIEPVYKRKWFEENLSGMIPVVVPNLNIDTWNYYISAYDVDQQSIVKAAAVRQRWIDQGQSMNIFIKLDKNATLKRLHELYFLAWELGIKSTYYLRSESPEVNEDIIDRSMECTNCQ